MSKCSPSILFQPAEGGLQLGAEGAVFVGAEGKLPRCAKASAQGGVFQRSQAVVPECAKRAVPAGSETGLLVSAKTDVPDGAEAGVHPGGRPGAGAALLTNSPSSLPECAETSVQ